MSMMVRIATLMKMMNTIIRVSESSSVLNVTSSGHLLCPSRNCPSCKSSVGRLIDLLVSGEKKS